MGHPHYEPSATDGSITHASESGWDPPYLPRALLEAPLPSPPHEPSKLEASGKKVSLRDAATFDDELTLLLDHLQHRLNGSVLDAWFSESGYGDDAALQKELAAIYAGPGEPADKARAAFGRMSDLGHYFAEPEEMWARAFAEMTAFLPYGGTGKQYNDGDQKSIYQKFAEGVHPCLVACQDLCTLCVLSRGFGYDALDNGVQDGCGCTAGTVAYPAFHRGIEVHGTEGYNYGEYVPTTKEHPRDPEHAGKDYTQTASMVLLKNDKGQPIPPGSVLVFNPGGPSATDQQGSSHIISVHRVCGNRLQYVDTGCEATPKTFQSGCGGFPSLCAIGVIRDSGADLIDCAFRMATSHPLGYVRMVILEDPGHTFQAGLPRFVSKLLHIRRHFSSYVWALRGLPVDGLNVALHFYITKGNVTTQPLLDDPSLASPPSALLGAKGAEIVNVTLMRGTPDGKAHVSRRRFATNQDTWYPDLHVPGSENGQPPPYEMGLGAKFRAPVPANRIDVWTHDLGNAGKRYIHKPSEDPMIDEGKTGVPSFDP